MRNRSEIRNQYLDNLCDIEDEYSLSIKRRIKDSGLREIYIAPNEANLIRFIISLTSPKNFIEVGTLGGYSTYMIAKSLLKDGKLISIEKEKKAYDIARDLLENCEYSNKIELIHGDAHQVLQNLSPRKTKFDAIFIDAEKSGYCKYLDWAEENIAQGGIIIGDNSFLFNAVYDKPTQTDKNAKMTKIMQEFNERLSDKSKYNSIILPTDEGMTVGVKRF